MGIFDSDSEINVTSTTQTNQQDTMGGNAAAGYGENSTIVGGDNASGGGVVSKIGDVNNSEVYQNFEGIIDKSTSNTSNITGDNNTTSQSGASDKKSGGNLCILVVIFAVIVTMLLLMKKKKKEKKN